ncbi:DUF6268 family outer membrane beta-barrel protein [Congregibacter brevis]|uniref:DUF6268 family outer membrane beta-barrel protein n=1 Tax=Congregibacter brevis TaxID=3081201 RepID=A0ABZ0IGT3_9GAMM|nr:DUF6268 family outer membrane beta-barrel protein [Congregibacter sp. IMCC45268]
MNRTDADITIVVALPETIRTFQSLLIAIALVFAVAKVTAQNFVQDTVTAFDNSEFIFQRSVSNAPFIPIAYLGARSYGEAQIENALTKKTLDFTQQGASAGTGVPFLISERDAVVVGAYLSSNRFESDSDETEDFRVDTVGLPLGWFRQVNNEWQAAAFVMPLGHRSTQESSDWTLQTMGGVFARYTQNEKLWWAFGLFGDDNPNDSYVIPYLGASWVINPRWTISAIMPWPAVVYSPTQDWMFRLGASPSGAAWSLQPVNNDVAVSLDAWDFGLSAERRIYKNVWLEARTGIGGLRGFRFNSGNGQLEDPDISVGSSGFFALSLKLRPAMLR